eukprot:4065207-Amphidinium_carterae.1
MKSERLTLCRSCCGLPVGTLTRIESHIVYDRTSRCLVRRSNDLCEAANLPSPRSESRLLASSHKSYHMSQLVWPDVARAKLVCVHWKSMYLK